LFDSIGDVVEEQNDKIEEFTDKIKDAADEIRAIDEQLASLNDNTQNDLASRFIEVDNEITSLQNQNDPENKEEIQRLKEERNLLLENTTQEERSEAIRKE